MHGGLHAPARQARAGGGQAAAEPASTASTRRRRCRRHLRLAACSYVLSQCRLRPCRIVAAGFALRARQGGKAESVAQRQSAGLGPGGKGAGRTLKRPARRARWLAGDAAAAAAAVCAVSAAAAAAATAALVPVVSASAAAGGARCRGRRRCLPPLDGGVGLPPLDGGGGLAPARELPLARPRPWAAALSPAGPSASAARHTAAPRSRLRNRSAIGRPAAQVAVRRGRGAGGECRKRLRGRRRWAAARAPRRPEPPWPIPGHPAWAGACSALRR